MQPADYLKLILNPTTPARMKKIIKIMLILFILIIVIPTIGIAAYMQHPVFGKNPSGERLNKIKNSPHYKKGKFRNAIEKPIITEGYSILGETYKTFARKIPRREPSQALPSIKTDLKNLPSDENTLVWFGHSTLFLKLHGKTFLVDPVLSGQASPIPGTTKAYPGTDIYTVDDLPTIDYLLISHDHYDHLDYKTILALNKKVNHVITGLGVGEHFEYWGYPADKIIERDWLEHVDFEGGLRIYLEPAHHSSGRRGTNSKNLWTAFVIQSDEMKIFYTGDGGYDHRFQDIARRHGGFDWAIMENGQYNAAWRSVHALPDEVVQATQELHARNMLPVHHSKFTLAQHSWDEPLIKISEYSVGKNYRLATPMIGERVDLDSDTQQFKQWWVGIE